VPAADPAIRNLPVDDARARMLAAVTPLGVEDVAIEAAHGRVLAAAIDARRDQPPFEASAMDGWAVRRADAQEAEVLLTIVGESAAGRGFEGQLLPGQAARIFTGAAVPAGADTVVIQENAERQGDKVRLGPLAGAGGNIRPRGGDFRAGQRLLEPGVRLDAWRLSLAAAAGCAELTVARRPRVVVLSTGEELVRPPRAPGPYEIYESGSLALCALVEACGGEPRRLAAARDDQAAVIEALHDVEADLLITVGGASVGDYDLVKPALTQLGLQQIVGSIGIRPGKPTWFGRLGSGTPVLGLPGNPASALVCAELFLGPLVRALLGSAPGPVYLPARLLGGLPANGPRDHFMRAMIASDADGALTVQPLADQDSSLVTVFALADGLLRRPAGAPAAGPGAVVPVLRLARL
jgi:molybdopterin molybdotransferase